MSWHWNGAACAGAQAVLAAGILAAASMMPQAKGTMLLISATGMTPGAILDRAMAAGALPVRAGPVPASVIVMGDRDRILAATLSHGILALDAPNAVCGRRRA